VSRVLVIDDDPHIRRLIALQLRGHEVAAAATGEEALDLAARESFDVVLVDLILPYFGGFRVCQKLKAREPAPRVIIMTGDDSQQTRATAREYGADGFLAKPFTKDELLAAL
jgi:DNA-binding response OmpR family regulator